MRAIAALFAACLASLALYGFIFGLLIEKPLTVTVISEILRAKTDYARAAESPKLVIFAGSNARFSHSCATIAPILKMPCVNFGVARGIAIDYLTAALEPVLKPGDIVYMPFEYDWYLDDATAAMTGPDAALMWRHDKRRLFALGIERSLRAFFSFDLSYAASGLVEMMLDRLGVIRRVGLQTMDAQGDETGHDDAAARQYRGYIASVNPFIPSPEALAAPSYAKGQIVAFLDWARSHGVTVYGGLQTTFDDATVSDATIAAIRAIYQGEGQRFLLLPSHSQYPRACFFDTSAHLVERCQIAHSETLAAALSAVR